MDKLKFNTRSEKILVVAGCSHTQGSAFIKSNKFDPKLGNINNKGETTLVYKHPITKTIHKTSIRKKNVEKIKRESINNKKEIIIENKEGKKFFLVKTNN